MSETRNAISEAIAAVTSSVTDLSVRIQIMEERAQTQASKIDQLAQTQEVKFEQMMNMMYKMNGLILDLHHRHPENEVIDSQTPSTKFSQVQSSVVRLESKSLVVGFGVMVESFESASTEIELASIDVTDKSDSAIATGVFEDGDLCLDVSTIDSTQAEVTSDLFSIDFSSVFVSSDAIIGEESFEAKFCVSNTISDLCLLHVCGNASVNFPSFCAAHRALSYDWYPIQVSHEAFVCLNPSWKPPDSRTHIEFLKLMSLPMPANYDMEIVINKEDLCIVLKETETMKGVTMEHKRGTKWLTNSYFFWVNMISLLSKEGLVRIKIRNLKLDVNSGMATPVDGGKDDLIRALVCGYSICKLGPSQENDIDVLKNYTAAEYFGYAKHIISRFRNDKEDEADAGKDSWDYSGNDSAAPPDDVVIYAAAEAYSETMWNKQVSHTVCLQSEVVKWEYANCGVLFPFLLPPAKSRDECLSLLQEYNIWCWTKYWELALSSIQKGLVLSSNWQGQLNTIKADAKGSKEAAGKSQRLEKLNKNGDEVLIMLDMRGDDDFLPGNIIEIELHNFITFDIIKCKPGPRLNLVIGPNGSGKSLIVCDIALGLGGEPQLLGRASSVAVCVKRGEESSYINISLRGNTKEVKHTIMRKIDVHNKSEWLLNGKSVPKKEVISVTQSFNIQVNNLTQFLPQDRVCEFAKLTPVHLLKETKKAVGDPQLPVLHEILIEKSRDVSNIEQKVESIRHTLNQSKEQHVEYGICRVGTTFNFAGFGAFLVRYINNFLMFSLPRPPEIADLEDKINFKGRGMLRIGILEKLRGQDVF